MAPTWCKSPTLRKTEASRTPLDELAQAATPPHSVWPMPRARPGFQAEPGQHVRDMRLQPGPKQQQGSPNRRAVPRAPCWSSLSSSRPVQVPPRSTRSMTMSQRARMRAHAPSPLCRAHLRYTGSGSRPMRWRTGLATTRRRMERLREPQVRQVLKPCECGCLGRGSRFGNAREWKKSCVWSPSRSLSLTVLSVSLRNNAFKPGGNRY